MEKTKEQNNEAIKKEVEGKAKQANNIDNQTAAINSENKIVDFDYVLNNNQDLAFRINNIQKLGFGMDYIKRLVSIKSDFSVGDSQSILEEEIEKVFNSLVIAITDSKNGIALNPDGTIDEEASEFQRAELAAASNSSRILSEKESKGIFEQISTVMKNENVKVYGTVSVLDRVTDRSLKDTEKYYKLKGLEEQYKRKRRRRRNDLCKN